MKRRPLYTYRPVITSDALFALRCTSPDRHAGTTLAQMRRTYCLSSLALTYRNFAATPLSLLSNHHPPRYLAPARSVSPKRADLHSTRLARSRPVPLQSARHFVRVSRSRPAHTLKVPFAQLMWPRPPQIIRTLPGDQLPNPPPWHPNPSMSA